MAKAKEEKADPQIWATGRRKSSVARVRLKPGTGKLTINRRELKEYFKTIREETRVLAPLRAVSGEASFDIHVNAEGGGLTGQSGAIAMGIARALLKHNPEHEHVLREAKFLTRDARRKERKKYGRRGARRGFQFSKR
ncbi:MAG: 30S ribosomal protein S9 [Planctomycetes bacterium]|nr:30S ribosomal protein S9 [Planctomycetota bacterium]